MRQVRAGDWMHVATRAVDPAHQTMRKGKKGDAEANRHARGPPARFERDAQPAARPTGREDSRRHPDESICRRTRARAPRGTKKRESGDVELYRQRIPQHV